MSRESAYRRRAGSTVVGDLRVVRGLPTPDGLAPRDILVHLPASARTSGRRYPVAYFHDGQNLFDSATTIAGEWRVDETLTALAAEGQEVIAVGVPNGGDARFVEYTPYRGPGAPWPDGGLGGTYLDWLVATVKPTIDAAFPTRPERAATAVLGSSLGGLISAWAAVEHGATFGRFGILSPAIPPGQGPILTRLRRLATRPDRVWIDVGTGEHETPGMNAEASRWARAHYPADARRIRDALLAAGLRERVDLRHVEEAGAIHQESAWARRLREALRFLFGDH